MDGLRLSLIVIGVVIIAAVYIVGRMVERSRAARVPMPRSEPRVESTASLAREPGQDFQISLEAGEELQFQAISLPSQPDPPSMGFMGRKEKPQPESSPPSTAVPKKSFSAAVAPTLITAQPLPQSSPHASDLIVSLTLLARDKQNFKGPDLHTALEAAGLERGELDIYHFRDPDAENDTRAVFSVANIVKPGAFNAATIHGLKTPGLALFMQMPGPLTASAAFDAMLETAQFIAQRLHGVVGDEQRVPLNPQRIRALRESALNYDFSHMQSGSNAMQPIRRPRQ